MFVTFGVMNVIVAMIVDSVMANIRAMDAENARLKREEKLNTLDQIQQMVLALDKDNDGVVGVKEMEENMGESQEWQSLVEKVNLPMGYNCTEMLLMLSCD